MTWYGYLTEISFLHNINVVNNKFMKKVLYKSYRGRKKIKIYKVIGITLGMMRYFNGKLVFGEKD